MTTTRSLAHWVFAFEYPLNVYYGKVLSLQDCRLLEGRAGVFLDSIHRRHLDIIRQTGPQALAWSFLDSAHRHLQCISVKEAFSGSFAGCHHWP